MSPLERSMNYSLEFGQQAGCRVDTGAQPGPGAEQRAHKHFHRRGEESSHQASQELRHTTTAKFRAQSPPSPPLFFCRWGDRGPERDVTCLDHTGSQYCEPGLPNPQPLEAIVCLGGGNVCVWSSHQLPDYLAPPSPCHGWAKHPGSLLLQPGRRPDTCSTSSCSACTRSCVSIYAQEPQAAQRSWHTLTRTDLNQPLQLPLTMQAPWKICFLQEILFPLNLWVLNLTGKQLVTSESSLTKFPGQNFEITCFQRLLFYHIVEIRSIRWAKPGQ